MLLTLPNVLSADELRQIRGLLHKAAWVDGRVTAGSQAAGVKNNQQLDASSNHLHMIRQLVLNALQRDPLFFSAALPAKILPPFVNRYEGEQNYYGFHVDSGVRQATEGGYIRADISATLFFSDPAEYDGGELVIDDTFGRHSVKLDAGSLVIYPSSSVHAVMPVTRGERLASFMFMQSMVRDASQRKLLFDLDMSLVRLRQQIGETEEVIKLTGVYHNLLRTWAESA